MLVPAQTVLPVLALIVIPTGKLELTVMTRVFEVAGLPVAQVAFEVNVQITTSPFEGIYVRVGLVPEFVLFTVH